MREIHRLRQDSLVFTGAISLGLSHNASLRFVLSDMSIARIVVVYVQLDYLVCTTTSRQMCLSLIQQWRASLITIPDVPREKRYTLPGSHLPGDVQRRPEPPEAGRSRAYSCPGLFVRYSYPELAIRYCPVQVSCAVRRCPVQLSATARSSPE